MKLLMQTGGENWCIVTFSVTQTGLLVVFKNPPGIYYSFIINYFNVHKQPMKWVLSLCSASGVKLFTCAVRRWETYVENQIIINILQALLK